MSSPDIIPFDMFPADLEAQVPEKFRVTDESSANWVVRRIAEAKAYAEKVSAWAEAETRRAQREQAFFLGRFGPELEAWAHKKIKARGGRQKSNHLPAGRVGYRTKPAKLVINNEPTVITWAKANCPEAINVTERCSKSKLNKHFEATGELPDGASLEPQRDDFYVR